ncbi:hypothetical protein OTU49_006339, partial [Cherax quadricarinatus]
QVWFDPRLRFNKTDLGKNEFSMNWMFAAKLWKPDTFFINGKNSYVHKITAPNTFIRLQHDGQITWSLRLTVRASCKMHLRKFPLDTQICPLSLASYGYNSEDMVYRWAPALVTVDADVSIAQYELFKITTTSAKVTVRRKETISTLNVKFHLKRLTGFFLLQVYVPCILIVCCSWVAFWITKKDVPGRVCLGGGKGRHDACDNHGEGGRWSGHRHLSEGHPEGSSLCCSLECPTYRLGNSCSGHPKSTEGGTKASSRCCSGKPGSLAEARGARRSPFQACYLVARERRREWW